jgi:multidrug efflux pump
MATFLNTSLSGLAATTYREGNKQIDVLLRGAEPSVRNLRYLKDLAIPTASGQACRWHRSPTIRLRLRAGVIWRRNRLPTITVRANVYGSDMQAPT